MTLTEKTPERDKAAKLFTNSLMIMALGFAIAKTMSGVIINHIVDHFALVGAEQGYMISMNNIGMTAAIISTIAIHFKFKKTSMLTLSALLAVVTMALTGLAGTFVVLLVVSFIFGFAMGWFDPYINSCVIDANPGGSAKYQSAMQGFYSIGAIIAPVVVSALLIKGSWREVYLILAPVISVALVIYVVSVRKAGKSISFSGMESKKITGGEILSFLKRKKSNWLLLTCMAYYIMQYGLFAWLVRYMSVQYGQEALGMTGVTVMWIFTTVSRFTWPRLPADNMKLHSFGALIAGVTLFIGIFSGNPWIMIIMVGAGALTTGNSLPTLMNRIVITYDGGSLLPTSVMLLTMQIIGMIVPPLLGWMSLFSMQSTMVILAVAAVVSGLFGFVVMRILK